MDKNNRIEQSIRKEKTKDLDSDKEIVLDRQEQFGFKDYGHQLKAKTHDLKTIKNMLDTAQTKDWKSIQIKGSDEFKQLVLLEAQRRGLNLEEPSLEKDTEQLYDRPKEESKKSLSQHSDSQQLAQEAVKIQAQNEMPTTAQINTSPKADVDSDVRFNDIGSKSIPSELKGQLNNWVNQFTDKQEGLNQTNKSLLVKLRTHAAKAVSGMKADHRQLAMKNYNENLDKAINGTTLNIPEALKGLQKNQEREQNQTLRNEKEIEL